MKRSSALAGLTLLALGAAGAALAEDAAPSGAVPGFVGPTIRQTIGERLLDQPDIGGNWAIISTNPHASYLFFDPAHVWVPFDPEPGQTFGPQPGGYMTAIPYKPEYKAQYMAVVAETAAGRSSDRTALCEPYGMPRSMGGIPASHSIVQGPDAVVMHITWGNMTRVIFLDGRPHPGPGPYGEDPHTINGHSVGRWEGDTLVVDTANMTAGVYDQTGAPHSDQVHLVERIRLVGPNQLEDRMTITDPVMLTGPWEVTRYYDRQEPNGRRFHEITDRPCTPDESSIDMSKGYQELKLPQEIEAEQKAGSPDTDR